MKSNSCPENDENFKKQKNHVNWLLDKSRTDYYSAEIEKCGTDQKALFNLVKSLSGQVTDTPLPPHESIKQLAEDFGNFFVDKIRVIRTKLDSDASIMESIVSDPVNAEIDEFSSFKQLSEEDVRSIIMKCATKSCDLDPITTAILKNCLDELLPVITTIVNLSLQTGHFPDEWKMAMIIPLIKKLGLDLIFKSYRPVSNLIFISKVTEKASALQICGHLDINKLYYAMQSSYRNGHSTETALLKVQNDVYCAMDKDEVVLLLLLDLSAAFDTVDHDILLQRLENRFRISGNVLAWIKSYLQNRKQFVSVGHEKSSPQELLWGVPQGSVLGPILFLMYTAPLGDLAEEHNVQMHCYADDTQPYLSFKPSVPMAEEQSVVMLENFITDIKSWMLANKLKLNDDKTMFLLLGRPSKTDKVSSNSFVVGNSEIPKSDCAVNLGTLWDCDMSMELQVNRICQNGYLQLRKIYQLRKYLTKTACESVVHAFITSRIDYCNSLLNGLPDYLIKRIQHLQNAAARVIYRLQKFDHITECRKELHWLPVKERIQFKTILLTYKSLNGSAPQYLADLLTPYKPSYRLRSVNSEDMIDDLQLYVPKYNLNCCGGRSFKMVAPRLWNEIPYKIRSLDKIDQFKAQLKTFLFRRAYKLH